MLNSPKSFFLILIFSIAFKMSFAQARGDFNKDEIIDEVKAQLTIMSSDPGILFNYCKEKNIAGKFVFDLTIEGKGNVLTVFMVSSDNNDIQSKNLLKDKLYTLRFENVKIPKKERVKFRHTLNL